MIHRQIESGFVHSVLLCGSVSFPDVGTFISQVASAGLVILDDVPIFLTRCPPGLYFSLAGKLTAGLVIFRDVRICYLGVLRGVVTQFSLCGSRLYLRRADLFTRCPPESVSRSGPLRVSSLSATCRFIYPVSSGE